MQRDISFSEGLIIAMTNPSYASGDNVLVTSPNHRLREGFVVKIIQARGYKTNDLKELVDDLGNVVDNNSSALIIESGANGYYTVKDVTTDSFVLDGKSGDCNFAKQVENRSPRNLVHFECAATLGQKSKIKHKQ